MASHFHKYTVLVILQDLQVRGRCIVVPHLKRVIARTKVHMASQDKLAIIFFSKLLLQPVKLVLTTVAIVIKIRFLLDIVVHCVHRKE